MIRNIFFIFLFSSALIQCKAQHQETTSTIAKHAMVVSANTFASNVGIEIIKNGGNAVDAAIAVQFALAVVYPNAGNIGGGGFMVIRLANGETATLDFREKAPANSNRDMYLESDGEVNRNVIESTQLASGVPGSVDGMWEAHKKYGTIAWEKLLQPAIALAENGFVLTEQQANEFNNNKAEFKKVNPTKNYFIKETEWKVGDTLIQSDLANTLKRIQQNGRDGFYKGETANLIVQEMQNGNGIMQLSDLENYHSIWRTPITFNYKEYEIISMPPPASGGVCLAQMMGMIETFPIKDYGFQSVEAIHLMTEAERRSYADRATWLGDPDFFDVPLSSLIDSNYLQHRMMDFNPQHATTSKEIKAGEFAMHESDETTHFSIVDAEGNAVAVTTTLNDSYGSKIIVNGAGFLLNNEMDDFSAKPGEANMYGLVGGEANAIAPGKRMLSSMTPIIVTKNDSLFMVLGSPGGSTIITSVFQCIINVIEFNMTMQQSVDAGRFHNQWLPDEILYERNKIDSTTLSQLQKMGHTIKSKEAIGRVDAILINANGTLEGAADKRGDDSAVGY
ncbi:MAG: gamma-glutamyltransferase [Bacteroidetes bacterium]|nr:gamma-glutamyltransferase [Bacteroidota bacterium]